MKFKDWIVETFFSRQVEKRAKEIADERYTAAVQRLHAIYRDCTLEEFASCKGLNMYESPDSLDGLNCITRRPDSIVRKEWIRYNAAELSKFVRIRKTERGSEQAYIILGKPKEETEE